MSLSRYIVLNPVRANLVARPEDWPWSSYRLMTGTAPPPSWLNTQWILEKLNVSPAEAIAAYRAFVQAGIGKPSPLVHAHGQLLLGDAAFITRFQEQTTIVEIDEITPKHRHALVPALQTYLENYTDRDEAMARAYATSMYSITAIARHFKVSDNTAARAIRRWVGSQTAEPASDFGPDPGV